MQAIRSLFGRLDYTRLGPIYCDEGGEAFWKARRGPCQRLGMQLARALRGRLPAGGCSLYVGGGVAELPLLVMETLELARKVDVYTLRPDEAAILNRACRDLPFRFTAGDARQAAGRYDHLGIVSVLNDPERYPELSALSYGRADPATFNPVRFLRERELVTTLAAACLRRLTRPALVTTTVEEVPWITAWCRANRRPYAIEPVSHPTALVGDPVCFLRLTGGRARAPR